MAPPDPKRPARVKDVAAMKARRLRREPCRACGAEGASLHHLIPRSQGGDDVDGNLVTLCGDGARGCHGALHGSPYTAMLPGLLGPERRDAEWVRRRIGADLHPEELMYVGYKLGTEAGMAYLARHYYWRW